MAVFERKWGCRLRQRGEMQALDFQGVAIGSRE
jgi:hypothetical protein